MGFGTGEWHTLWSQYPGPSQEKRREVLSRVTRTYLEVFATHEPLDFPIRTLAIAHVYDDCPGCLPLDEAPHEQALDIAIAKGFVLTRYGFIDGREGWLNDLMARNWCDQQLIAESNMSFEQVTRDKNHGTMAEHVNSSIQWQSPYVHMYLYADSYKQATAQDWDQFTRSLRPGGIGYRLALTSASWESVRALARP